MGKRTAAAAAVLCALLAITAVPARAQTPSVEEELLALINTVRSPDVVMHAGLREVARQHSASMAAAQSLNHRRAKARIDSAQPDRPETGGPPDHGFTGTWCEVVGWEPAGPDVGVARRFFDDWRETPEDNTCLTNYRMTVAGLGVYERGNRWWATLEMTQDTTPPRPGPRAVLETPVPTASASALRATPRSTGASLAESRSEATSSSGPAWPEIAVSVGGFCVVPLLYTLKRRRAARRRPVRV